VSPGLEMIADGDAVEAVFLGRDRELHQLSWSELFCGRLVAELQREHASHFTETSDLSFWHGN
jgi:hypothetical protein